MWQQEKKDSSIVSLALLLALATIPTKLTPLVLTPALAQSPAETPAFPLPQSVDNGTVVRVDGDKTLAAINQGIKQSFEQQFSGTTVEVASNGTDAALKALLDGNVDVVALSRGLTPEEKAQGLEQVRLRRERIAVFVSVENPFKGSLTNKQFARVFRGEITDWAELGGDKGQIRVIDRPTTSYTRSNLGSYPAFKTGDFTTGANATQVADDNTTEIIQQLGKDGISYALASQVSQLAKLKNVRILNIDKLSPDDANYPFSQPLVYVYKQNPPPGIAAFLGLAIAPPGQKAIDDVRIAEANAISTKRLQALPADANPFIITQATAAPNASPLTEVTTAPNAVPNEQPATTPAGSSANNVNPALFLWLLLPVFGVFLLWWFLGRPSSASEESDKDTSPEAPNNDNSTPVVEESTNVTPAPSQINPAPSHLTNPVTINTSDVEDAAWDSETPATVVSNAYPQLPDVPLVAFETQSPTAAISSSVPQLGDIPEVGLDTDVWSDAANQPATAAQQPIEPNIVDHNISTGDTAATAAADIWSSLSDANANPQLDSPELPELTLDAELPTIEVTNNSAELPELPDVELNAVADAAEFTGDFVEEEAVEIVADIPEQTNPATSNFSQEFTLSETATSSSDSDLTAEVGIGAWTGIYGLEDTLETNAPAPSTLVISSPDETPEASITLTLQSPEWAYVSWQIPAQQQQALRNAGVSQLTLRLCDVTSLDLSYQSPQLVAEYELGEFIKDRFVAIPATGRDYITEIGYSQNGEWVSIARSAKVRCFSPIPGGETAELAAEKTEASITFTLESNEWAKVSWQIPDNHKQALHNSGVAELTLRLYDATGLDLSYQSPELLQEYEVEELLQDRLIEVPATERDYVTEIGYVKDGEWVSIARSAIAHVFSPINHDLDIADTAEDNTTASIIFTFQSAEQAHVAWQIPDPQQTTLNNAGVSQLTLRLYDVTELDLSYENPQLVQEYPGEALSHNRLIPIPATKRDYITEIGYIVDSDRWVAIARSEIVRFFKPLPVDTAQTQVSITLKPHTAKWAYVSWQIPQEQQQELENAGVANLTLRLCDTTEIDLSYQQPQLLQEYEIEGFLKDRFVSIPATERDYISEIGYIKDGEWVLIARSAIVRCFSPLPDDADHITASIVLKAETHELADVTWEIPEQQQQALENSGISQVTLRLYDATELDLSYQSPQLVQEYPGEALSHNRALPIPTPERDYITEIGYLNDGEWIAIARSAIVHFFSPIPVATENTAASIVLKPHTPKWAYVAWQIPETQTTALQNLEVSQLILKLYAATAADPSNQNLELVEQYEVEILLKDRFVAIPATERDYITEIGYLADSKWVLIARSSAVRISSQLPSDTPTTTAPDTNTETSIILTPRTPKWAYVSWQIPPTQKAELQNSGVAQLALRLYDATDIDISYQTPQLVQQYSCEEVTSDRFVAIPTTDRDYLIEIGYITEGDRWIAIARSPSVRVFSRPQTEFWFVTDAELIIHGATQPNATVTVGGHSIKLKPDGTFHLRIPFSDNVIEYLLTAVAANGQDVRNISKKFSQEHPPTL
jgi:phosphate transport system substrate-binding protein